MYYLLITTMVKFIYLLLVQILFLKNAGVCRTILEEKKIFLYYNKEINDKAVMCHV